jgi:hypothetical protein
MVVLSFVQEAAMNKRTKTAASVVHKVPAPTRVIRVSEETWAARIAESSQKGEPRELAAYFDRALKVYTKAS